MSDQENLQSVPRKVDLGWFRPDGGQKVILVATIAAVFLAAANTNLIVTAMVALTGTALYAPYGPYKGAGYMVIYGAYLKWRIRRNGGALYQTDLKDALLSYDSDSESAKVKPRHPFGTKLWSVPLKMPNGEIHMLPFFSSGDYITMLLVGDGNQLGMNGEEAQRFLWDGIVVDAVIRAVNLTDEQIKMSLFCMNRAPNKVEIINHREQRWHKDFLDPEPGSAEARFLADKEEEANRHYDSLAGNFKIGIAIRMKRPRKWKVSQLGKLTYDDVNQANIIKVIRSLRHNLEGAVTNVRYPNLLEANEVGYLALNAIGLDPFYADQERDIRNFTDGELKDLTDSVTLRRGPWPGYIKAGNAYLLANQTLQTTLMVTEYEKTQYPVGFFDSLFYQEIPFIYSLYIETQTRKKSINRAKWKRRATWGIAGSKNMGGTADDTMNLEDKEMVEDAAQAHYSLFQSRSRGILMRQHLTVAAGDPQQLELNAGMAQAVMSSVGMTSTRYFGEPYQLSPVLSSLCILPE